MTEPSARPALIPPVVRAFLRGDLDEVDPALPGLLKELCAVGAGECWHKKSTFKEHLFQVGAGGEIVNH